ncbi:MAG: transporter substrate-binding domain-containing protein [Thermomicrobiales bacterium]|nr:transporter substrate-binding domain-containing protein [Thermomicrobiales bacterium]MCO5220451.1 transporter substrate-binding domain-containing protein [Thermomicrobiales bacterium]
MPENRIQGMTTSRRSLISRGALIGGAAAAVSLPSLHAMAQDATSDSLLGRILDRGKIVVGTGSTNPPWHFEDENGQLVGFDISLAMLLAGGIFGLDQQQILDGEEPRNYIDFVVHEADARIPDLLADKVDINFQFMTVTPARALQVAFTVPYYREGVTVILPSDSEFNSLAEMQDQGLTIAILANVTAEDMVRRGIPDANVEQFDSVAASVEALDSGRVDATAIDMSTGRWMVAQDPDAYKTVPEGWDAQSYAASIKPGDQVFLNFVDTALMQAMVGLDFPIYQAAFKTYFGEDLPNPPIGFPVEFA